jgi:hypothetical protein
MTALLRPAMARSPERRPLGGHRHLVGHQDPADSIGTLLADEEEAAAVARVVREIVPISERQQPGGTDRDWFMDEAWPRVRAAAGEAAALLRRDDA